MNDLDIMAAINDRPAVESDAYPTSETVGRGTYILMVRSPHFQPAYKGKTGPFLHDPDQAIGWNKDEFEDALEKSRSLLQQAERHTTISVVYR